MRKFLRLLVFIIFSFVFVIPCFANGNPTHYKMTIQAIYVHDAPSNTWVLVASPNQEVDIVGDSSGQNAVAASLGGISIPPGTYDNFKLRISETMKVTGSNGADYTKAGGVITITGLTSSAASTADWPTDPPGAGVVTMVETVDTLTTDSAQAGEVSMVLDLGAAKVGGDSDNYIEVSGDNNINPPLTVTSTSQVSMWFSFDTQNTVQSLSNADLTIGMGGTDVGGNGATIFLPPQAGTTFSITVDGRTESVSASGMRIDF